MPDLQDKNPVMQR